MNGRTAEMAVALPGGGGSEPCAERLQTSLAAAPGVEAVEVDARRARLTVRYDADRLPLARLETLVAEAGAELGRRIGHETLRLGGLDCADCATTLEKGVARLPGILNVSASFAGSRMTVEYETGVVDHARIVARVRQLGYDVAEPAAPTHGARALVFAVTGMDCADCARNIERQVAAVAGVRAASVDLMAARLRVEAESADDDVSDRIARAVGRAGYGATPEADAAEPAQAPASFWRRHAGLLPTAVAAAIWVVAFSSGLLGGSDRLTDALYGAAILVGGHRIARSGYYALVRGRTLGIDALMTIAVVGAALIGQWSEGAAVVVLFSLGEALEGLTMDKARNAIRSLMDLSPREATVKTAGGERRVPVEQLALGDVVVVRPGELVAADGRVTSGATSVDQAPITGESVPVDKAVGDAVFAGTVNQRGYVEVEVTRRAEDTTLAKIVHMVEEAQATRAPSQRFVDGFARYYTPAVVVGAALVALVPPLLGQPFEPWLYKALVLLVIACPCALVISTPVAIVAGIARASRSGVLIKGGAHLEAMASVQAVAFDKTGTLTEGQPAVADVVPLDDRTADDVLALAAAVESRSEHPLAGAVLREARARGLTWGDAEDFEALTGLGARAVVGGSETVVGSPDLFRLSLDLGPSETTRRVDALRQEGKTVLLVGRPSQPIGIIAVADRPRPAADRVVARLRAAGVERVVMLTGDNAVTARAIAARVGVDETRAGLLPEQKTAAVRELLSQHRGVAMVGDGVNDAPALATATVGIAMGAAGSDTALETADVALMSDDLARLPDLLRLSRAARATIRGNVAFALVVKAVFLALTFAGLANLWLAILADTGAALVVIANGMRLLRFPDANRRAS